MVTQVAFYSTGREWVTVSSEGLHIYSINDVIIPVWNDPMIRALAVLKHPKHHIVLSGAKSSQSAIFRSFVSPPTSSDSSHCHDPTAWRPTKICDPYEQGGRPLVHSDAEGFLSTLDNGWFLIKIPKEMNKTKLVMCRPLICLLRPSCTEF